MENFPCDGCDYRSSCKGACGRLHKFLREDKKCHTRVRTTELVLSPEFVAVLSDRQQSMETQLSWQELSEATPGYWDINLSKNLTGGEKILISEFYLEGLSYRDIAAKYRVSSKTVSRHLTSIRKKLRKLRPSEREG